MKTPFFGLHMVPRIVLSVTELIGILEVREAAQATKSLRGRFVWDIEKRILSLLHLLPTRCPEARQRILPHISTTSSLSY